MFGLTWTGLAEFKRIHITIERFITLGTVLFILLAWYVVTDQKVFSEFLVPTPGKVYSSFNEIIAGGYKGNSLFQHFTDSMIRLLTAYVLVIFTAIPIGLLSGYHSKIRAVFEPLIEFYRPLPPLAY